MKNVFRFFCGRYCEKSQMPYWKEVVQEAYLNGLSYTDETGKKHPVFVMDQENPHLLIDNTPESCKALEQYMEIYLDKRDSLDIQKQSMHHFFQKKYEEFEKIKRINQNKREFVRNFPKKPDDMLTFSEILDRYEFPYNDHPLKRMWKQGRTIVLPNTTIPVPMVEFVRYKGQVTYAIHKEGIPTLKFWYPAMRELQTEQASAEKPLKRIPKSGKEEDLLKDTGLLEKMFVESSQRF